MYERDFMDVYHDGCGEIGEVQRNVNSISAYDFLRTLKRPTYWFLLDGLEKIEKEIIDLMYFDNETLRTTARILGISENEVANHLLSGVDKLHGRIKPKEGRCKRLHLS